MVVSHLSILRQSRLIVLGERTGGPLGVVEPNIVHMLAYSVVHLLAFSVVLVHKNIEPRSSMQELFLAKRNV